METVQPHLVYYRYPASNIQAQQLLEHAGSLLSLLMCHTPVLDCSLQALTEAEKRQ